MNSPNQSTSLVGNLSLVEKLLVQFQKCSFFQSLFDYVCDGTSSSITSSPLYSNAYTTIDISDLARDIDRTTKKITAISNADNENDVDEGDISLVPDGDSDNDGDSSNNNTSVINEEDNINLTIPIINQGTADYFPIGFILSFSDGDGWTSRPNGTARKTVVVPLATVQSVESEPLNIVYTLTGDLENFTEIGNFESESGNHFQDSYAMPERNNSK